MTSSNASVRGLILAVAVIASFLASGAAYAEAADAEAADAEAADAKAAEPTDASDEQEPVGDEDARKAAMAEARTEALALLEEMSVFLAEQKSFSARSEISYDVVQPRGLRLEFGTDSQIWLRRPDGLRIERRGREGDTRTFRYDGKQVSLMFDDESAYVQVPHEGSIDEMLDYVVDELGMPMPLSDLFDTKFYANVVDRIGLAAVVGDSRIAGQQCVQAVYRAEEVDFQIWIAAEGDPLPCRIVIAYKQRRGEPAFRAEFSDWQLGIKIPDARFEFEPPKDAERLRVRAFSTKGEK